MWPNLNWWSLCKLQSSYEKKVKKYSRNCLTLMLYNDWTDSGVSFIFSSIIQNKREVSKNHLDYCYQVIRIWRPSLKKLYKTNVTKIKTNLFLLFLGLEKKSIKKKNEKYLSVSRTL